MTPPLSSEGFRRFPSPRRPPWAAAPLPDRHIALADALADDNDWSTIESVIDPFGDVTAPDVRVRAKALVALYPRLRGPAVRQRRSTTADPAPVAATN